MFRPVFIEHRGRRILRLDYSGLSAPEAVAALETSAALIAAEPAGAVRALTLWDAPLSHKTAEAIRAHVVVNTPHIFASAVVTPRPLQKVFFDSMKVGGRERLRTFDDEAEALEWLTAR